MKGFQVGIFVLSVANRLKVCNYTYYLCLLTHTHTIIAAEHYTVIQMFL